MAILGSLVDGLAGTAVPVIILGTGISACLGAFAGSLLRDLWEGRPLFPSFEVGWGAAVGRFWGTIAKLAVGALMVVILALALFRPYLQRLIGGLRLPPVSRLTIIF